MDRSLFKPTAPRTHCWDYPRLSLASPNLRKPNLDAHMWLGLYTPGEPASPLHALSAALDIVDEEEEDPYYSNEC